MMISPSQRLAFSGRQRVRLTNEHDADELISLYYRHHFGTLADAILHCRIAFRASR